MNSINSSSGQTASEKKYGIHPDEDFDLCNVVSAKDMTGLVPAAILTTGEYASYGDMFEYQAQDITVPKADLDFEQPDSVS